VHGVGLQVMASAARSSIVDVDALGSDAPDKKACEFLNFY